VTARPEPPPTLARFGELVGRDPVPLGEAAIALAAHLGFAEDPGHEVLRLQALAAGVDGADLAAVTRHLFATVGLRGDRASYYDPANSMLPLVLDRGRGIPISLAVIAVDVARRLGIEASVVGMPGHVLVGAGDPPHAWVDAFGGGRWLDALGARALYATLHGRHAPFDERFLATTPDVQVLARMLNNLVGIYGGSGDARHLVRVHQLRAVLPGLGEACRPELAHALEAVGRFQEAADLWDEVGGPTPEGRAAEAAVRRLRARLN
jgi:regulator of sirC expression with transglutaminase-like and TPR domain